MAWSEWLSDDGIKSSHSPCTRRTSSPLFTWAYLSLWRNLCRRPGQASRAATPLPVRGRGKVNNRNRGRFGWMILAVGGCCGRRWDGGTGIVGPTQEHWILARWNVANGWITYWVSQSWAGTGALLAPFWGRTGRWTTCSDDNWSPKKAHGAQHRDVVVL